MLKVKQGPPKAPQGQTTNADNRVFDCYVSISPVKIKDPHEDFRQKLESSFSIIIIRIRVNDYQHYPLIWYPGVSFINPDIGVTNRYTNI